MERKEDLEREREFLLSLMRKKEDRDVDSRGKKSRIEDGGLVGVPQKAAGAQSRSPLVATFFAKTLAPSPRDCPLSSEIPEFGGLGLHPSRTERSAGLARSRSPNTGTLRRQQDFKPPTQSRGVSHTHTVRTPTYPRESPSQLPAQIRRRDGEVDWRWRSCIRNGEFEQRWRKSWSRDRRTDVAKEWRATKLGAGTETGQHE